MLKLLRLLVAGIFIAFIGILPLGTINLSAMQIAITDGVPAAIHFALGLIPADVFYVLLTLLAMQWIHRQQKLFRALEWATLAIVALLAAANFYAAFHPTTEKNVVLSSTLPPFILGFVMNGINPLQIPFWLGWNTVLFSRKWLAPGWTSYSVYALGVSMGLFAGTALFIFGGKFLAGKLNANQSLFSLAIGSIFVLTAIYYFLKMRRRKTVTDEMPPQQGAYSHVDSQSGDDGQKI